MTYANGRRRGGWRAAFVLVVGLGSAAVLPSFAGTGVSSGNGLARPGESRPAVQRLIVTEAVRNGRVPAPLALAVAEVESDFVPRTADVSGAIGVMQLQPAMAESEFGAALETLWDPATNVRLGLRRLTRLHRRYDGDWELALSHFRGGALHREDGRYRPHDYTRAYLHDVMRLWRRYQRDPLVRAWIREAHGAPRFVSGGTAPYFEGQTTRRSTGRHRPYPCERRFQDHRPPLIQWDEPAAPHRPGRQRFNGGGAWTAIGGSASADFRRAGRWVAVTGGGRFR